jgi:hypothetical protein
MSQPEQISFFLAEEFIEDYHSTLICGSVRRHMGSEAGRLDEKAVSMLTHTAGLVSEFAGKTLVGSLSVPSCVPEDYSSSHGFHCLALLEFAADVEWDYLWYVHHDVYLAGNWSEFFDSFENSDADYIAPCVRNRLTDPDWYLWDSLDVPPGVDLPSQELQIASLNTIFRISRKAFDEVRQVMAAGWLGHSEAIFATAVAASGLKVEDIGGSGEYTPESRLGLHYSDLTFRAEKVADFTPGFLHYPVMSPTMMPSPFRFRPAGDDTPKILFFSPIGLASVGLLHETVARFREADAEFLFVEYQAHGVPYPEGCRVLHDKGQKWELVRRHLNPEDISEFDYIFVWDDDIDISDFDVLRFVKIMESNRLAVAQPSLVSPHPICHQITRQKPCMPPLGNLNRVGRLTNFVEIMVPVFTRDSWVEFYSYLSPASRLGWGMDSLQLGNKGIIDCMHVIHTRRCSEYGPAVVQELRDFLNSQGILECRHQELGYLLEAPLQKK